MNLFNFIFPFKICGGAYLFKDIYSVLNGVSYPAAKHESNNHLGYKIIICGTV